VFVVFGEYRLGYLFGMFKMSGSKEHVVIITDVSALYYGIVRLNVLWCSFVLGLLWKHLTPSQPHLRPERCGTLNLSATHAMFRHHPTIRGNTSPHPPNINLSKCTRGMAINHATYMDDWGVGEEREGQNTQMWKH
jgi:hypothetical protein